MEMEGSPAPKTTHPTLTPAACSSWGGPFCVTVPQSKILGHRQHCHKSVFKKLQTTKYNWQCSLQSHTHRDIYTHVCVFSLLMHKDSQNSGKYMHSRNQRWWSIEEACHPHWNPSCQNLSWTLSPRYPLAAYLNLYFPSQVCPSFKGDA